MNFSKSTKTTVFRICLLVFGLLTVSTLYFNGTQLSNIHYCSKEVEKVDVKDILHQNMSKTVGGNKRGKQETPNDEGHRIRFLKTLRPSRGSCNVTDCISSKKVEWKMFIFVKSMVENVSRRQAIRKSWGSLKYLQGGSFTIIFIVGNANDVTKQALLDEEYERFADILQINSSDSYFFVPYKVLAGMEWASMNLDDETFYSTCDDDMYVNVVGLHKEVRKYVEEKNKLNWPEFPLICSYETRGIGSPPIRSKNHKNYISESEYRWPAWPKFCLGGMYTTTVSVAGQLYKASKTARPILRTDDVWITGVLRNILGLPDSMVMKPDVALAKHYAGFHRLNEKQLLQRLKNDFKKDFSADKFDSVCLC